MFQSPGSRRDALNAGPMGSRPVRLAGLAAMMTLSALALGILGMTPGRSTEAVPFRGSLAGQLLVATADMPDPRFARTVLYMVRHDATGAQGVVVNRPLGEMPLAVLLDRAGLENRGVHGVIRLRSGGPVEPRRLFVLHTGEYPGELTLPVKDGIALTWDPDMLLAIARGNGPRRALLALGYAGWGPGQLEAEMKTGAWAKASADEAILFDGDDGSKWDRAIARRKIDL